MEKLRVWDKKNKAMHNSVEIHNGKGFGTLVVKLEPELHSDDFVVMLPTGKTDQNGIEIYEGDKLEYADPEDEGNIITGYVVFSEGTFMLATKNPLKNEYFKPYKFWDDGAYNHYSLNLMDEDEAKIVGHLYQEAA